AEKLMPISLELGGKSPTIVFEDCDLGLSLQGVLYGIFSSTGQACIAGSRLFVQASIYDQFVTELVARTQRLRVGHPEDPTTQVGPLISAAHRHSVESYVKLGLDEGGTLLAGGKRPEGEQYAAGSYYLPTIIGGLSNQARICQEEIFGPVLVVMPFKDESDLLAQANDSVFGLAAGVWTRDYQKAWRMARLLQAGTIWINTYKTFSVSAPFGGFKDSGLGREKGRQGIRAYQQQKSVYWALNETPNAWAY
ncbi:MAG TPA: aldehyde dehydrogenase family protein, partial [Thiolinea sp.]|nr:aldehyde dehydrogenase family protein [Thiolinea sp.]